MEISEKTVKFIKEHSKDDVNALRLKYSGKSNKMDFPIDFALLQIEARRKAQRKIPTFLENVLFFFPDILSAEQASNEAVARFHASLVPSGSRLLDLTAGLGIDDMTFAKNGIFVTACEINRTKAEVLKHNANVLGLASNITVQEGDSMVYVDTCEDYFDVIFADPARRSMTGKRLHALSDCQPDIHDGMASIMRHTDRLMIKTSPMLDISFIRDTISNLFHIHIICFKGECKELLIDIRKNTDYTGLTVVDLDINGIISSFKSHHSPTQDTVRFADKEYASEYTFLYEPNAGVMKTGAWDELTLQYPALRKADINTHLFLSDELYEDFPGRIMTIEGIPDKKDLKALKGCKFNIVARNHPLSAPELEKKHSLISGGDRYLYAFRYKGKPICVLAKPSDDGSKFQYNGITDH